MARESPKGQSLLPKRSLFSMHFHAIRNPRGAHKLTSLYQRQSRAVPSISGVPNHTPGGLAELWREPLAIEGDGLNSRGGLGGPLVDRKPKPLRKELPEGHSALLTDLFATEEQIVCNIDGRLHVAGNIARCPQGVNRGRTPLGPLPFPWRPRAPRKQMDNMG